jgi:anaerobic ribonucleoside-triphosphate reductase activating protein
MKMEKHYLNLSNVNPASLVNGEGIRFVIFFQGCKHKCKGCHAKNTWSFDDNKIISVTRLVNIIEKESKWFDGLTLSGGDPLYQEHLLEFLIEFKIKIPNKNIWLYTGFNFDEIDNTIKEQVDVIVDGPYIESMNKPEVKWRGSYNQNIWKKVEGKWINSTENQLNKILE